MPIARSTKKVQKSSRPSAFWRVLKWVVGIGAAGALSGILLLVFVFAYIYRELPPIDALTDYRPKVPLRVWSADGKLIGEFGEERRDFVKLSDVPDHVKYAILSAEDDGFYEHPGIEITGIVRAALINILTGRRGQGGSTITQQVARNFFLTTERTYTRKLYEIAMSFKIEHELTKDQILEIYMNQIYLGQRAYGFAAAARTYFGRPLTDISVGEAATIAGLPVAPSAYNPIANPTRATMRRNYVLRRMYDLGHIDDLTYQTEKSLPMQVRRVVEEDAPANANASTDKVTAHYAAELARMMMFDIFGDETYSRGINVYTTIRMDEQPLRLPRPRGLCGARKRRRPCEGDPYRALQNGFFALHAPCRRDGSVARKDRGGDLPIRNHHARQGKPQIRPPSSREEARARHHAHSPGVGHPRDAPALREERF